MCLFRVFKTNVLDIKVPLHSKTCFPLFLTQQLSFTSSSKCLKDVLCPVFASQATKRLMPYPLIGGFLYLQPEWKTAAMTGNKILKLTKKK